MDAIKRLEQMLDAKDERISELERKLEAAEQQINYGVGWARHKEFTQADCPNPTLPVPRLELRWSRQDGETVCIYSLVYRHLLGDIVFVPLGRTKTSGALQDQLRPEGRIHLPFRDGSHFANEMRQLGLRGFVICGDAVKEALLCSHCGRLDDAHHGERFGEACRIEPTGVWR